MPRQSPANSASEPDPRRPTPLNPWAPGAPGGLRWMSGVCGSPTLRFKANKVYTPTRGADQTRPGVHPPPRWGAVPTPGLQGAAAR